MPNFKKKKLFFTHSVQKSLKATPACITIYAQFLIHTLLIF